MGQHVLGLWRRVFKPRGAARPAEHLIDGQHRRMRVFFSYSRADLEIARELLGALEAQGLQCVLDQRDLPYAEKWQEELGRMIRTADAVLFLVSRRSIESRWCAWELAQVATYQKRLVPLMLEDLPPEGLPMAIQELHLLTLPSASALPIVLPTLVDALTIERTWVVLHTQLIELSARWLRDGSDDLLLRGRELARAQDWLRRRPVRAPMPSVEVAQFVAAGAERSRTRSRRQTFIAVAVAGLSLALAWVANDQRQSADASRWYAEAQLARRVDPDRSMENLERSLDGRQTRQNLGVLYPALALRDRLMTTLRGHEAAVQSLQLDAQRQRLLSASDDGSARVWNLTTLKPIALIHVSERPLLAARFSPDGRSVIAMDEAGMVVVADGKAGYKTIQIDSGDDTQPTQLRELLVPNPEARFAQLPVSPNSTRLATWSPDGIWLVELPSGRVIRKIQIRPMGRTHLGLRNVQFSADSSLLLVQSAYGVELLQAADGLPLHSLVPAGRCDPCQGGFSITGRYVLLRGRGPADEWLFRVEGSTVTPIKGPEGARLQWLKATGSHAAWLSADRLTLLETSLDLPSEPPTVTRTFSQPIADIQVDSSPQARFGLVLAGKELWRWNTAPSGYQWSRLSDETNSLYKLQSDSPDLQLQSIAANVFVPAFYRDRPYAIDEEAPVVHYADTKSQDVFRPVYLPWLRLGDTAGLLTRNADGRIDWWDLASHSHVAELAGHTGDLRSWVHDASTQRVYAAAADGTIRVWNVRPPESKVELGSVRNETLLGLSSNRRYAVISNQKGEAHVIDLSTGAVLSTIGSPKDHDAAAVSNDGRRVVTVSTVWHLAPGEYQPDLKPYFRVWETSAVRARLLRELGARPDPALSDHQMWAPQAQPALLFSPAADRFVYFHEGDAFGDAIELWNVDSGQPMASDLPKAGKRQVKGMQVISESGILSWTELGADPDPWRFMARHLNSGRKSRLARDDGSWALAVSRDSEHVLLTGPHGLLVEAHGSGRSRAISIPPAKDLVATFGARGRWLAIGNEAGAVDVLDVYDGSLRWHWNARRPIRNLRFSHDGRSLLITTSETFQVLDIDSQVLLNEVKGQHHPVAVSLDDRLFVTLIKGYPSLHSMDSGQPIQSPFPPDLHSVRRASFNDRGQIVLEVDGDSVQVWDCTVCVPTHTARARLRERLARLPIP